MDITHVYAFVAGFFGKVVGGWFIHFFNEAVLPYFYKHTNPHISIDDEWILNHIGHPADGEELTVKWKVNLQLKQKGQSVVGTATSICSDGPQELLEKTIRFDVKGSYTNSILDLHLTEIGNKPLRNRSALMLQLVGDGSTAEGYRIFLGRAKNQIRAIQCKLIRRDACSNCGTA